LKDEENDEDLAIYDMKTFRLEVISIGISLICQTFTEKRKEFAFIYLEDLKFLILDADQ